MEENFNIKNCSGASGDLTKAIAKLARKLRIETIYRNEENSDLSSIEAYVACRLIPLAKNDGGVRPIGIGQILRRIVGKAIQRTGSLQLCAGHPAGCEAAVHAMSDLFVVE